MGDWQGELTELARSEGLPVINVSAAMYMENSLGMMAVRPSLLFSAE
jgi:hypothetical protein